MTFTRKWIAAACLGTTGLAATSAGAQTTAQPPARQPGVVQPGQTQPGQNAPTATPRTGQQTQPATADQAHQGLNKQIAVCLTLGNEAEIALAEFANQRSQNPEVKRFAQHMIEQHRQALSKIQQASPETAGLQLQLRDESAGGNGNAAATTNDSGIRQVSAEEPVAGQSPNANDHDQRMVQMARQIKQECLNLTQQELSSKEGVEFDKAYIGQQVGAHLNMLAELRGSKQFATGQLQQVIADGEQMTEKHFAEAQKIMSQLKDQQGSQPSQTTQRPGATTQPTR